MSYTAFVKKELSYKDISKSCCEKSLLSAIVRLEGKFIHEKNGYYSLRINTQDNSEARWFIFAMNRMYSLHSDIRIRKSRLNDSSVFLVKTEASYASQAAYSDLGFMDADDEGNGRFTDISELLISVCDRYAYYRGAFLSCGLIKDPDKGYYLEIASKNGIEINRLFKMLQEESLVNVKRSRRRRMEYLYFNNSEDISTFLNMIGAHNSLMDYENKRIEKSIRNDTNRMINCDEYNADKSVDTKIRQINAIRFIQKIKGLDFLNDKLKETAMLRLNEDLTEYNEIAEQLKVKVSKSTVQKRLAKIEMIAKSLGYNE
ncbi:MAG TPA: DNA-binding protein WhiA [Clostridia bacterium]|nr:MAG: Sporulation transcription regulator WhiA [Firmicutes bacterium ADurb.Bin146]HOD93859.1 DNA-binding protein WhiA [Clostridia bacterium]HQM39310.1 DNA-binding protein WhiA [Clostridia bacterium]